MNKWDIYWDCLDFLPVLLAVLSTFVLSLILVIGGFVLLHHLVASWWTSQQTPMKDTE